jgi:hypothetical protein
MALSRLFIEPEIIEYYFLAMFRYQFKAGRIYGYPL